MFKKSYVSFKKSMKKLKNRAFTPKKSNGYDGPSEEELFFGKSHKQIARAKRFRRASALARNTRAKPYRRPSVGARNAVDL
jgi:hypothetical protein